MPLSDWDSSIRRRTKRCGSDSQTEVPFELLGTQLGGGVHYELRKAWECSSPLSRGLPWCRMMPPSLATQPRLLHHCPRPASDTLQFDCRSPKFTPFRPIAWNECELTTASPK